MTNAIQLFLDPMLKTILIGIKKPLMEQKMHLYLHNEDVFYGYSFFKK